MANADSGAFGRTLARLRLARGFTQQQIAGRISTYYSDAGAYGRVERGDRHPDREAVIAILVRGLLIREISEVNGVLQLAGYEPLNGEEIGTLGLIQITKPVAPIAPATLPRKSWLDWTAASILVGSLVSASLIAGSIPGHAPFALLSSGLYAALYVVSLYLESSFDAEHLPSARTAALTFAFVSLTSIMALATDRALVGSGDEFALLASLGIFLLAGILQFALFHRALAESVMVTASFQTLTAQSAHLKNTGYFLLVVVLFWLPSFHCVTTLSRETRSGHIEWVRAVLAQDVVVGRGVFALSVRCLLGLLLLMFLIAGYMGAHLLDNLQPNARVNSFTQMFYLRAFLYFVLCLVCIGWFAYSLSKFG